MDLRDMDEISHMAEALRARCEAAGAANAQISWRPGEDVVVHITSEAPTREIIRLGAEPAEEWRIPAEHPGTAFRKYKLGIFSVLDTRPAMECDVIPAVVIPRGGA